MTHGNVLWRQPLHCVRNAAQWTLLCRGSITVRKACGNTTSWIWKAEILIIHWQYSLAVKVVSNCQVACWITQKNLFVSTKTFLMSSLTYSIVKKGILESIVMVKSEPLSNRNCELFISRYSLCRYILYLLISREFNKLNCTKLTDAYKGSSIKYKARKSV